MSSIQLKNLSMGSCIKLFAVSFASLGAVVGVIALIGSLVGLPVRTTFLFLDVTGVTAGALSVVVGPIAFGLLGSIVAILAYYPFTLLLKLIGGLSLET